MQPKLGIGKMLQKLHVRSLRMDLGFALIARIPILDIRPPTPHNRTSIANFLEEREISP